MYLSWFSRQQCTDFVNLSARLVLFTIEMYGVIIVHPSTYYIIIIVVAYVARVIRARVVYTFVVEVYDILRHCYVTPTSLCCRAGAAWLHFCLDSC